MSIIFTFLVYIFFIFTSPAINGEEMQTTQIDVFSDYCYSGGEKSDFTFIRLMLFPNEQQGGFAKHINGPTLRLKYLYTETIETNRSATDEERQIYAEMMNNKMTGYYIYTVYTRAPPGIAYFSKKKNKMYNLSRDLGAAHSKIQVPAIGCDWSKSNLLNNSEN